MLSPEALKTEIDELEANGVEVRSRLRISPATPLIMPYHIAIDQAREKAAGKSAIGTTGRGIGPAYEDKVARRSVRVADLMYPSELPEKLRAAVDYLTTSCSNIGSRLRPSITRRRWTTRWLLPNTCGR